MSSNSSNGSNTGRLATTAAVVEVTGKIVTGLCEIFVLGEILWYYLHDGEQTLHGAIAERWDEWKDHRKDRADFIDKAARAIDDLPETE